MSCSKTYTIDRLLVPLFYYKLDGLVSGNLHDEGAHSWDLALLSGAATFPAGIISNGMAGTGDYRRIDAGHALIPAGTSFTVRFWLKLETGIGGGLNHILLAGSSGTYNGLVVDIFGVEGVNKTVRFELYDSGAVVADVSVPYDFSLTYDAWHHFVFTYTVGVGIAVRVDNTLALSDALIAPLANVGTTLIEILTVSARSVMDEVGMWDTAWTAAEITADYNSGSGTTYP